MGSRKERLVVLASDFLTINLAWLCYYLIRVESQLIPISIEPDFWVPLFFIYFYWLIVFAMVGLYRPWYAASRFDEIALLFKTITFGCLFLFFTVFVDDQGKNVTVNSRLLIAIYWGVMIAFVSTGRLLLRSIQRRMLIAGIGVHNTLIVGSLSKALELHHEVKKYPALGYKVIGFVGLGKQRTRKDASEIPLLGELEDLHEIVAGKNVRDILIALDSSEHDRLLDVITHCNSHRVGLKIMPDLYDIISGQARTNQIYGFPLIEISPQLMKPWEEVMKRVGEAVFSAVVLVVGLPLWILIAILIKIESRGPVFYKQKRVGKDGEHFNIIKFRSMHEDAEREGPQWAGKQDPRVTNVGKLLRRLHLDEIPQLINILSGNMSLVGPRPERPLFVEQLSREIPLYTRRLKVRPGLTGLAQVRHKYDETIDDVRKKVQYDLSYIENMSLRMDIKIILGTIYHMILGRGR